MVTYILSEINMSITNRSDIFSEIHWDYMKRGNPPMNIDFQMGFAKNGNIVLINLFYVLNIVVPWIYAETAIS